MVTEKLDGSCVLVGWEAGELVARVRSGHRAGASRFEQHRLFARWVGANADRFAYLGPDERVAGEWLAQAHGTRYDLAGRDPFVVFDVSRAAERSTWAQVVGLAGAAGLAVVPVVSDGPAVPVDRALGLLGEHGHYGAVDPAEGLVYRCETADRVEFLAKWVRAGKVDGGYVPGLSTTRVETWNWRPAQHDGRP